jgi:hypothetical protein
MKIALQNANKRDACTMPLFSKAKREFWLKSLRTDTRLAPMVYSPSAYAKPGGWDLGERNKFKVSTTIAAYFFQALEDSVMCFKKDMGEEISCVCVPSEEI